MKNKLQQLIKTEVNIILAKHHGGCELVSVDETNGVAEIKLSGSCTTCPGKRRTFELGVIPFLLENIEGLKQVNLV